VQPFHLLIAALHQHHNVICLNTTSSTHTFSSLLSASVINLPIGCQNKKASSHLHPIHSYHLQMVSHYSSTMPTFFFFFFFTMTLLLHMAFFSRARQLSPETCAPIHTLIYFLSSLLSHSLWTADVFLRLSPIMINLPFIYLLYFFLYAHTLLVPCFFFP
jgi:hypothetical protein